MSADSAVPANIITDMDSTAFRGLNANSSEEMMPLPYWKEPSSAAAVPAIAGSTEFKAAAFVQAATTPFMPNTKNTVTTTPYRPPTPVTPEVASATPATVATRVATLRMPRRL